MPKHSMRVLSSLVLLGFSDAVRSRLKKKALPEAALFPGYIEMKRPAFILEDEDTGEFMVSCFGRRAKMGDWSLNPLPAASSIDRMSVAEVKAALNSSAGLAKDTGHPYTWVGRGLAWPNILSKTPKEVGDYVVAPDGFLPPLKSNGGIFLIKPDGTTFRALPYVSGAFYHEVEWHDIDGDGLKDMVTARTIKKMKGFKFEFKGELLWAKNPGNSRVFTQEWETHLITEGPDVALRITEYGEDMAIWATEFFNEVPKISINFVKHGSGEMYKKVIVDDNLGSPFGIELVDIDGDGKKDLLATNHQDNDDVVGAAVYAYEIPDDITTGTFKRHTLTEWPSPVRDERVGSGAPGFATAFYPRLSQTTGPKHIVAAGDGSWDVWYLRPTGEPFKYDTQTLVINGTTGQLKFGDYSGDGIMDVIIPDNDNWKIYAMTFNGV